MTYKRDCPYCSKTSYSCNNKKWICPYCNKDITDEK